MFQRRDETLWSNVVSYVFTNTVSHPIEYAKVLIQIGYEPLPPTPTTTLFGTPALGLPNIFQYVRYIRRVDGFVGCYRGFVPKLCAYTVSAVVFEKASDSLIFEGEPDRRADTEELSERDRNKRCVYDILRQVLGRVAAIIASHPLDVIAFRAMAQFVGRETKYNGLFRSIIEVYRENGIAGYYAGIVPRLLANVATIVMVGGSTYAINKYIIRDREINAFTGSIMTFLCTSLTYPFYVVSNCMVVNNCGLAAGLPPHMPIYENWLDCWSHLSSTNQLKRGSNIVWRYYRGPTNNVHNWRSATLNKSKLKSLE